MLELPRLKSIWEYLLSFGAHPGESDEQRGRRRIIVGASWIANTATVIILPTDFLAGDFWVGVLQAVAAVIGFTMFVALRLRPRRFVVIVQVTLGIIFFIQLVITALLGGLLASGLEVVFGLIMVLAVLIGVGVRAAAWWFGAFVASVFFAALIPTWVVLTRGIIPLLRSITHVEIPADGDYLSFSNPGGPGPTPFPDVRYTAPGPPDLEPVTIALDDPMRVSTR